MSTEPNEQDGVQSPAEKTPFHHHLKKTWVLALLTLAAVGALSIFFINKAMVTILHSRPEVTVPALEGKGLTQALEIVSKLQLSLTQDGMEFDETLPAGTIVRQQPPSGMQVRTGRAIRVVVSKGGQAVYVPDVNGKRLAEAQSILAVEGLQLGALAEVYSADFDNKVVISQDPSSGTVVTRGALVDVEVSKGAPPAGLPLLPDFMGKSQQDVHEWAQGIKARVRVKEDAKSVGVAGTVVKQNPAPGQPLLEGQTIDVTIVPVVTSNQGYRLNYQIPNDVGPVTVRMMARDNRGESQVYKGEHEGGQTIEIPMSVNSTTRVRIYLNDVLKDEKVIEP